MDVESFAGKLRKSPTESLRKQEGSFGKVSRIHIYRGPVLWIVCTDYGTVTEYVSYVCLTFCGRYRVLTHHESASSATQVVAEDGSGEGLTSGVSSALPAEQASEGCLGSGKFPTSGWKTFLAARVECV